MKLERMIMLPLMAALFAIWVLIVIITDKTHEQRGISAVERRG